MYKPSLALNNKTRMSTGHRQHFIILANLPLTHFSSCSLRLCFRARHLLNKNLIPPPHISYFCLHQHPLFHLRYDHQTQVNSYFCLTSRPGIHSLYYHLIVLFRSNVNFITFIDSIHLSF